MFARLFVFPDANCQFLESRSAIPFPKRTNGRLYRSVSGIALITTDALAQASPTCGYSCNRVLALNRDRAPALAICDLDMAIAAFYGEVTDLWRSTNLANLSYEPTPIPPPELQMRPSTPPMGHCMEAAGGSNRKIESRLPERAEEFDLRAAVHDDFETCVFGKFGGLVVIDADLPP